MVTRANNFTVRETDKAANSDSFPVFDTSASSRSKKISNERFSVDEVIMSLSDSYENRRARQVVEWVRLQGTRRTV